MTLEKLAENFIKEMEEKDLFYAEHSLYDKLLLDAFLKYVEKRLDNNKKD